MDPIKVFVINLARSPDRREKMAKRLSELNLPFEFFDGVDGATLLKEEITSVHSESAAFDRLGRLMPPNEMACSWSHIKIYETMVQEGIEEAVVLEDDIDLSGDFPLVLASRHLWLPGDWRVVNFAHDMSRPIPVQNISVQGLTHLKICRFERVVGRTGAYLVNVKGAETLLKHAFPIRMPPDDLIGNAEFVGVSVYGIIPRIAMWDDNFHSTIWTDRTREQMAEESRGGFMGLARRLRRRINRLFN